MPTSASFVYLCYLFSSVCLFLLTCSSPQLLACFCPAASWCVYPVGIRYFCCFSRRAESVLCALVFCLCFTKTQVGTGPLFVLLCESSPGETLLGRLRKVWLKQHNTSYWSDLSIVKSVAQELCLNEYGLE